MEMLSDGFAGKAEEVFGRKFGPHKAGPQLEEMRLKAERATPKPTAKLPLHPSYAEKLDRSLMERKKARWTDRQEPHGGQEGATDRQTGASRSARRRVGQTDRSRMERKTV
jgi:hypothetical protein